MLGQNTSAGNHLLDMTDTNLLHFVDESLPVAFNDLKHHVVLNVLDEVEHPLPEGKRCCVGARG